MKDSRAIDQTEIENLNYEFPDETLEIAAAPGEKAGESRFISVLRCIFAPALKTNRAYTSARHAPMVLNMALPRGTFPS
jgi:hypothetical protein